MDHMNVFTVLRLVFFWLSPVVFFLGVVILTNRHYQELEKNLIREVGGIKKRVAPVLESDHFEFHNWLMDHRRAVGMLCIVISAATFLTLK